MKEEEDLNDQTKKCEKNFYISSISVAFEDELPVGPLKTYKIVDENGIQLQNLIKVAIYNFYELQILYKLKILSILSAKYKKYIIYIYKF